MTPLIDVCLVAVGDFHSPVDLRDFGTPAEHAAIAGVQLPGTSGGRSRNSRRITFT